MAKPTHKVTKGRQGIDRVTDHSPSKKVADNQSHKTTSTPKDNQSYKN